MDREERYRIRYTIEDTLKILDSSPTQRDLVPEVNLVQLANRAPIAHINIEKGIKALIAKAGGQPSDKNTHELGSLYDDLKNYNKGSADFLSTAFDDAVDCFDINTKFRQFNHLTSIDSYFSLAETEHVFQELRYWSLGESDKTDLFKFVVLPIHREILYALWCFIVDDSPIPETVSKRIEREVHRAMWGDMSWSSTETEKEKSLNWYIDWLNNHKSSRAALMEAVEAKFVIKPGDGFIVQKLRDALDRLQKSEDAAVCHFAHTLSYLPKGSPKRNQDAIPEVDWWNKHRSRGEVKTAGGTHLGFIEQYADKSWGIDIGAMIGPISKTLEDAKHYLVNYFTERIEFEINGKTRELRIIKKELYEKDSGTISDTAEISPLEQIHDLELWDSRHGINPGDKIIVPLPFMNEDSGVVYKLEGKVEKVEGPKISIFGWGVHGFRNDRSN